jgi:HAD superfamily hydrolase (TIGR01509 family)
LVFDFDGLIVDTETPEVETWREVFAEHGTEFPDDYWINAIGRGADQILETPVQLLARCCIDPIDAPAVKADHHRRVMARIDAQPTRPGIVALLDDARDAGLRLGVASSSRHEWVDRHLARHGLLDRFHATTCADDVARAKPFPDLYLLACERLGVSPSEAVALEDSPNGIAAARSAGLFTVTYPNALTRHLDLSAADHRVETLEGVTVEALGAVIRSFGHSEKA